MTLSETVMSFVQGNDYFAGSLVDGGSDIFVPTNKTYPHIHMNKRFVVYSKTSSNHMYLIDGDDVSKTRTETARQDSKDACVMQICSYILSQLC